MSNIFKPNAVIKGYEYKKFLLMSKKITIKRKQKTLDSQDFFQLLDEFIKDSIRGRRLKKNGDKISQGKIVCYQFMQKNLLSFVEHTGFEMKFHLVENLTFREKERAANYWRKFYNRFTNYMYYQKDCYDNYVGSTVKELKVFFNYVKNDRLFNIGDFHKSFYIYKENIDIIALSNEQLHYFIYDEEFHKKAIENNLDTIKDIFVFGCTVALRVSDLFALTSKNIIKQRKGYYLVVKSQKTKVKTMIKLPDYAIEILQRYEGKQETVFPKISLSQFNSQLRALGKFMPDNFIVVKTREKKGKPIVIYKDKKKKQHYHLSDHLSSHVMRRTAITNMLTMGVPEHVVRKISGHSANSKEFFRYVELSQRLMDNTTDEYFEKMKNLPKKQQKKTKKD